jgi:iron complex outermembrane receptor protein
MTELNHDKNRRVLVIDDNRFDHDDFHEIAPFYPARTVTKKRSLSKTKSPATLPRDADTFRKWILCAAVMGVLLTAALADAADTNQPSASPRELENLTLEELVNVKVTSVSKKETDAFTSPTAISVITQDDIQRNGFTSIPDALRMVPGLDVAQINASQWAVSSRGFNYQYADKLLVLVDGRSVYTPAFSGVIWEIQDLVMEDLDRIEVIRGPGAALWGDNAVNGVINITTKSARETQGGLVSTSFGTDNQSITSLRYGDQLSTNLFYRVFLKFESQDGFLNSSGNRMPDGWDALHGGARFDWEPNPSDRFTLQGDYLAADIGGTAQSPLLTPPYATNFSGPSPESDGNVVGRWTHDFSPSSQLTVQMYFDHSVESSAQLRNTVDVYDFDLQHRFALGERQDIVWGAGARDSLDDSPPAFNLTLYPERNYTQIYNVFAQDDVTVVRDRFHLILGTKFDHNTYTGFELQPGGRLLWTPSGTQTAWMAVSRAVSTPSQVDEASRFNESVFPSARGPVLVSLLGNPSFQAEEVLAYELGYRLAPSRNWSFDLATYYNVYQRVQSYQMGSPYFDASPLPHLVLPETAENNLSGESYGTELSVQWKPADYWRLTASYSWLHMELEPVNTSAGDSPRNQFQIHSYLDLSRSIGFSGGLYYVSALPDQNVPSYVRLDLGLTWRVNKSWEAGIFAQNLADSGHVEFGSYRTPALTEIPRAIYAKITWRF